jgi:hypothetical protein
MIRWRVDVVRHIPEEELHAYLDQALSRSQCIEIETHLARCLACAESRDAIAALRDRTTALLDRIAPPRLPHRPAYEMLAARARMGKPQPLRRYGLWAASLAGAVLAGWGLRTAVPAPEAPVVTVTPLPAAESAPAPEPVDASVLATQPTPPVALPPLPRDPGRFTEAGGGGAGGLQLAARGPSEPSAVPVLPATRRLEARWLALDGSWEPLTLEAAAEATGQLVPLVPELPVAAVHARRASAQQRPLLVVTQEHPVAGFIHTVEGPVEEVARLVTAELRMDSGLRSSDPARSLPDYIELEDGIRRIGRVLVVVGLLPVDSLNALAQAVVMR